MRNLDDELKRVLRREEPPEGFADRVLRRKAGQHPQRPRSRWYQLAAVAALIIAMGAGAVEYRSAQRERAERAAGEAATAQVMLALEIARAKLQLVQTKIHALHDVHGEQPKNANR